MNAADTLMQALFVERTPATAGVYAAWVTPRIGEPRHIRVRAEDMPHARLAVQGAARREYPHGFSFSVRPL